MMNKENFTALLRRKIQYDKYLSNLSDFGVNICETEPMSFPDYLFDSLLDLLFDKQGNELVFWWLYEDDTVPIDLYCKKSDLVDIDAFVNYLFEHHLKK